MRTPRLRIADYPRACNPAGMKPVLLVLALAILGCSSSPSFPGSQQRCPGPAAPADTSVGSKPIVVLLEANPWAMVIGSDSPSFALYSDNLVIYRVNAGYKSVKLAEQDAQELLGWLDVDALACVLGDYETTEWTDQKTTTLFLGRGGQLSSLSVYGDLGSPKVPVALRSAYTKLRGFQRADARPWLPEKVEVMVWPYEHAPDASIVWPREWPGIDSPETLKRGDSYSIYLPSADYPRLLEFLKGQKEKGAVEIGGRKWAAAIRLPFPGERMWLESISERPAC